MNEIKKQVHVLQRKNTILTERRESDNALLCATVTERGNLRRQSRAGNFNLFPLALSFPLFTFFFP